MLHDPDLASAILDRVLERGRWITLDGTSGRTQHLKLDPATAQDGPGATVSGKLVPEFPERTRARPQMWTSELANQSPDRLAHRGGHEVELHVVSAATPVGAGFEVSSSGRF